MSSHEQTIYVDDSGNVQFIYSDDLKVVASELGGLSIRRASHVEPTADGNWDADMSPIGGPVSLGGFVTRQDALEAEVAWIEKNYLGVA